MSSHASTRSPLALFTNLEFVALASAKFASGMSFATIIIALAFYADIYNASGIVAGLFGTAYAVMRFVLVLPVGRYVDIGNSKRYLLAGLLVNAVVLVGFMFVSAVEHVVLLRVLQGAGSIILTITIATLVGEIGPDDERGLWMGTYNQVGAFSSLSGDLVGGALLYVYSFEVTYAVLLVLVCISTVAVYGLLRENPGTRTDSDETTGAETLRLLLRRRAIRALVLFRFAFSFGKMAVIIFLPIYARTQYGMNALMIGGILAGGKLTKALAQGHIGTLSDRVGRLSWFIFAGTILYAVGTALIPFAAYAPTVLPPLSLSGFGWEVTFVPAFFALFGSYVILGVADSLRIPTSMALFVQEGEHYQAVAGSLSLRSVSWQVGAIVGPLAVGGMLDFMSFFEAFWLASGFMVVAGIVFITAYSPEPAPETAIQRADD